MPAWNIINENCPPPAVANGFKIRLLSFAVPANGENFQFTFSLKNPKWYQPWFRSTPSAVCYNQLTLQLVGTLISVWELLFSMSRAGVRGHVMESVERNDPLSLTKKSKKGVTLISKTITTTVIYAATDVVNIDQILHIPFFLPEESSSSPEPLCSCLTAS